MKQQMFNDKSPEDRIVILRDTCDKAEVFKYEKAYTNQDVEMFRERLSEIMIEIGKIESELAKVKKIYSDKMKPLKKEINELLSNIEFRSQAVEEQVYIFIDHEANQVGYYNSEGLLVHTRMLKIDEHQRSIIGASRVHDEEFIYAEVES